MRSCVKVVEPCVKCFSWFRLVFCGLHRLKPLCLVCSSLSTHQVVKFIHFLQAYRANVICPNKHQSDPEKFHNNHLLDSETYIGGHVECLETGVFRSDLPTSFKLDKSGYGVSFLASIFSSSVCGLVIFFFFLMVLGNFLIYKESVIILFPGHRVLEYTSS